MDGNRGADGGRAVKPIKILVIDGEEHHCRLYKEELEDDGYTVLTASTWKKGIDLFWEERPDVITVDACMTDCEERIGLLGQMKEASPGVSIVLLTAYDNPQEYDDWYADFHVIKSSDLSELKQIINSTRSAERDACRERFL